MDENVHILHISDLHFGINNDDQSVVISAFLDDIADLSATPLRPSLVAFSGDLVWDGDDHTSYINTLERVLIPIIERLHLSTDDVILAPGNHDARRSVIKTSIGEHAGAQAFTSREAINDYYASKSTAPLFVDKFANFSALERAVGNRNLVSSNTVFSTYYHKKCNVGLAVFNTAWCSGGGLTGREKGALFVPEAAVNDAMRELPNAMCKIVVTHHPLSWLNDENAADFKRAMPKACLHLMGHVHDPEPTQQFSPSNTAFICQSGALFTNRRRYNGYSIISVGEGGEKCRVTYRSYFDKRRRFDVATDILAKGVFYSSSASEAYWLAQPSQVSRASVHAWISGVVAPAIRASLIDSLTDRPIHDIFVPPVLLSHLDVGEDPTGVSADQNGTVEWLDFVVSTENHLIRGRPEFGKSTVLRELCYELTSSTIAKALPRVPVLISYSDVPKSSAKLLSLLRGNAPECPNGTFSFSQLAEDGYLCVLIDDVDPRDGARMSVLSEFMRQYPKNRYVVTTLFESLEMVGRIKSADFPVAMQPLYLDQIGRGRMRQIVGKLHTADPYQQELLLNRILNDLRSMNVPVTAVNGTILLTIFQTEKVFVPVNRAIVLDRFIDILLKRYSIDGGRRSAFDFRNKTHLLSQLARWMCEQNSYDPPYEDVYSFVSTYLSSRGLKYDVQAIIADLITCRVLAEKGNRIAFHYRSFLEFFVARAMDEDTVFRDWVVDESRYLSYIYEIEYYSGLNRNDGSLLRLIGDRFRNLSQSLDVQLDQKLDLSKLDKIVIPLAKKGGDVFGLVHRQLGLPALTQQERDELLEGELPQEVAHQDVYRPLYGDDMQRWIVCLMMYSRVLRNMELVDKVDKIHALKEIIYGWGEFLLRFMQTIPNLAKHRMVVVNGIRYEVAAPPGMTEERLVRYLMMNAPRQISTLIFEFAGSEKLHGILEQDDEFSGETLVEKVFRKLLYADLRLPEFIRVLDELNRDLKRSPYLAEALIWKLHFMYRRILLSDTEDEAFRRVLARALAHGEGERGRQISAKEASEFQRLEKQHLIQLMRRRSKDGGDG
jgi:predicted MPP superfamily phosphohydrolase